MRDPAPRGPSLSFLVISWIFFLVVGVAYIAGSIWEGRWLALHAVYGLGLLWLAITGLLVRRLWPKSKLARLLPETAGARRYDQPVARPLLTILVVLVGAIAIVAASLYFGWH